MNSIKTIFNVKKRENWIPLILFSCFVCQFLLVVYFNFFQVQSHLGVDASWEFLKAQVVANTNRLYPQELFNDTTAPFFDRNLEFAALLYKLTGNIFVSEAIVNVVFLGLILLNLWAVMTNRKMSIASKLFALNLMICPYLTNGFNVHNEVGFFSCLCIDAAFYNFRTLELMLFFRILTEDEKSKKCLSVTIVAAILSFISGVGSGLSVVVVCIFPLLVGLIVVMFVKNDIKVLISAKSCYMYLCVIMMAVGQLVGRLCHFKYVDTVENWISADGFWSNLGNEILGYMLLLGAIPTVGVQRTPFSLLGITYIFGLIIFVVLVIAFFYSLVKVIVQIRKYIEHEAVIDDFLIVLVSFSIITFLEFALIAATYGEVIFERRYVMMGVISGFVLIGIFIDDLSDKLLFKKFGVVALVIAIIGMDLYSDYTYMTMDQDSYNIETISSKVDSTDAGLVYFWGKELCGIDRVMRVVDQSRVYKCMDSNYILEDYGDYTYYDDSTQYQGPTLLITPIGGEYPSTDIMDNYEILFNLENVEVYYCKDNPIDLKSLDEIGNKELLEQNLE